jgi:hypothetical protein
MGVTQRMLTERNYHLATQYQNGFLTYVVYADEPQTIYTTTGFQLQGADLERAQQHIEHVRNGR